MENLFFIRFLLSSLMLSVLTLVIIGIKRVFQNHISVKWQYNMWMIFLVMLIIPFIPQQFLNFGNLQDWGFNHISLSDNRAANINLLSNDGSSLLHNERGLQDFALSVNYSVINYFNLICLGIGLVGVVVCTMMMVRGHYTMRKVKYSVKPIRNKVIENLFKECKSDFKITKNLILGESSLVQTPMVFGLRKTYIVLPSKIMQQLSLEDIKYILLHELTHYKNKDILINYIMCFFQIIYWFNPFVYWAFREMRKDREIACDIAVLKRLDEDSYIHYGRTIINFAEILSQPDSFTVVASMGGSKKQIKKRIEKIAYFKKETRLTQIKSLVIFIVSGILIFTQAPAISVMAYENNQYDFQGKQVVYEDLSPYFKGIEGSFVLYDLQTKQYNIHNKEKSVQRVSPNSTYKIYSALIALEDNIIQKDNLTLNWNGEKQPYEAWNHNQDLYSAMENSVSWYFQQLDKAVGQERVQYYFDQMEYGNSNLSGGISHYWMESSLRISPIEQVELLKDFYTNDMIFQSEHINLVKESLKISERNEVVLSGKTGTGVVQGKEVSGWFIGYVERAGEVFIFATNIQDQDGVSGSLAAEITLSILKDKNIY